VRSVADDLRERTRAAAASLPPLERLRLALELGDRDAEALARTRGVTTSEARRLLARQRSAGRVASVANATNL
jgi:hypothetical protein